ncbi:hypothetical protein [Sinorhizobium fredii]|uniref:hypothetical protein n=1 Tax=Rhizobium fredii TaxID=380 RepID=UPI00117F369C
MEGWKESLGLLVKVVPDGDELSIKARIARARTGGSDVPVDTWPLSTKDSNNLDIQRLPCDSSGLIRGR